ncbi:aspartate/glutamate racemase family protein [bacterium]|nr:aspartate/glutamate racemase family protein [bacterium]
MDKSVKEKVIGIIGGMGPAATSDLLSKIIELTKAKKDQDHIHVIVDNNSKIPDRTQAIFNDGESPLPALIESGKMLERAQSDFIIIPCNTAHFFYDELKRHLKIPIVHIIREVARKIHKEFPNIRKVGLLSTRGTIKVGLYQKELRGFGVEVIKPDEKAQDMIAEAIFGREGIKSGYLEGKSKKLIYNAIDNLINKGAELIIGGCTEIPLVVDLKTVSLPFVSSNQALAESAVKTAKGVYA